MKKNLVFLLSFMLSAPLVSLAATKNSKSIDIQSPTLVANHQLNPGTYKVEWNGHGPNVQVAFLRNNKEVATAPAKVTSEGSASSIAQNGPALETHMNSNKASVLDEIDFKNIALKFDRVSTGA
ncbi:MAG TPA: hypothetical protein VJS37_15900 [Terriglobales bacterium]|nr:hypothetical protein [Terriglobales bacterium]